MKKLLLLCGFCLAALLAKAQPGADTAAFNAYSANANKQMMAAAAAKNYKTAIAGLNDWIKRYDQLPPTAKANYQGLTGNLYYNLACYEAQIGEKAEAEDYLQKAIDGGYREYAHMLVDSDLDNLRNDKKYKAVMQGLREKADYGYILAKSGTYNTKQQLVLPAFTYQDAAAPELVALRKQFNLDSIAGNGDEISKFKKLLYWVHNAVPHDGNSSNPKFRNAAELIAVCKKENRGVNCRMMATILRDVYQAEGFPARIVTCMPKDTTDFDCHVINVVWSKTLNKWIWMDPTFNAYVSDDKGNLLNIEEVRTRLINGSALIVNDDANWNNKVKETREYYLGYYMSKNLYWLECSTKSEWNVETRGIAKPALEYLNLYPDSYNTIHQLKKVEPGVTEYAVNDPNYFWQRPGIVN